MEAPGTEDRPSFVFILGLWFYYRMAGMSEEEIKATSEAEEEVRAILWDTWPDAASDDVDEAARRVVNELLDVLDALKEID